MKDLAPALPRCLCHPSSAGIQAAHILMLLIPVPAAQHQQFLLLLTVRALMLTLLLLPPLMVVLLLLPPLMVLPLMLQTWLLTVQEPSALNLLLQ